MADILVRVGTRGRSTIMAPPAGGGIVGTAGVWERMDTGSGMDITLGGGDAFGIQSGFKHPTIAGTAYCFPMFNGCWQTQDYGATWTQICSTGPLMLGKCWAAAISADGSVMFTGIGNVGGGYNIKSLFVSTNGGVTWSAGPTLIGEPYCIEFVPGSSSHCFISFHDIENMIESTNANLGTSSTWTDLGDGGASISSYVFPLTDTLVLQISQGDDGTDIGGTQRWVKSGTWSTTKVAPSAAQSQQHFHGSHQGFIDETTSPRTIWNAGAFGNDKSIDEGVTWTRQSFYSNVLFATAANFYSCKSYPTMGTYAPDMRTAARPAGTFGSNFNPSGMGNGAAKGWGMTDGTRSCVVTLNWRYGIWRYIEP